LDFHSPREKRGGWGRAEGIAIQARPEGAKVEPWRFYDQRKMRWDASETGRGRGGGNRLNGHELTPKSHRKLINWGKNWEGRGRTWLGRRPFGVLGTRRDMKGSESIMRDSLKATRCEERPVLGKEKYYQNGRHPARARECSL